MRPGGSPARPGGFRAGEAAARPGPASEVRALLLDPAPGGCGWRPTVGRALRMRRGGPGAPGFPALTEADFRFVHGAARLVTASDRNRQAGPLLRVS